MSNTKGVENLSLPLKATPEILDTTKEYLSTSASGSAIPVRQTMNHALIRNQDPPFQNNMETMRCVNL